MPEGKTEREERHERVERAAHPVKKFSSPKPQLPDDSPMAAVTPAPKDVTAWGKGIDIKHGPEVPGRKGVTNW